MSHLSHLHHHLREHFVFQRVQHPIQHEVVSSREVLKSLHLPLGSHHLPLEQGPAELRHHHPRHSVDHPQAGEPSQDHPPQPNDEEVLLVEEVVGEDAQIVALILSSCSCSYGDVAGNLCGEELAHGVVYHFAGLQMAVTRIGPEKAEDFCAIGPELIDQQHVAHEHVEKDHADVESLTESKMKAVGGESLPKVHEVLCNDARLRAVLDDFVHELSLEAALPEDARHLGEPDGECEEEGEPEVVGSHPAVPLFILDTRLVNVTASGFTLQVLLYVARSMDPAVRFGIVVSIPAVDGSSIDVILKEDEHEAEHEDGSCVLVMHPEQEVVNLVFVTSEPLQEVLEHWQLPKGHWSRHFDVGDCQ